MVHGPDLQQSVKAIVTMRTLLTDLGLLCWLPLYSDATALPAGKPQPVGVGSLTSSSMASAYVIVQSVWVRWCGAAQGVQLLGVTNMDSSSSSYSSSSSSSSSMAVACGQLSVDSQVLCVPLSSA